MRPVLAYSLYREDDHSAAPQLGRRLPTGRLLPRLEQPVKEAEEQERGRPLADEKAPIVFAHNFQTCGGEDRSNRRPVPGLLRNAVRYLEILLLWFALCHAVSPSLIPVRLPAPRRV